MPSFPLLPLRWYDALERPLAEPALSAGGSRDIFFGARSVLSFPPRVVLPAW